VKGSGEELRRKLRCEKRRRKPKGEYYISISRKMATVIIVNAVRSFGETQ
jgi:hypothetical protein